MTHGCVYCDDEGGLRLWRDDRCRVVLTDEPFAGFCRVIWNAHVAELTDLAPRARAHLLEVVCAVEGALRARLAPATLPEDFATALGRDLAAALAAPAA